MLRFLRTPAGLAVLSALVVAGCGALFLGLESLYIDNDVRSVVPGDHPVMEYCDQVDKTFGSADRIVVGFQTDTSLSIPLLKLVRTITSDLEQRHEEVMSVTNTDTIVGEGATLKPLPLLDDGAVTDASVENLLARLEDWNMFDGTLVSKDRKSLALLVTVPSEFDLEGRVKTLADVRATVEKHVSASTVDVRVWVSGEPVISLDIGDRVTDDLGLLSPLALLAVLILLIATLRSVGGVVGPVVTVGFATGATFGLMGYLERPVMVVTSAIPVFMIAVGSAYGIHIVSHFKQNLLPGVSRAKAAARALKNIGGAVTVAAATTIAGFLSLGMSDIVPIRDFGVFLAFGIGVALLASVSIVPLILLIGRKGKTPAASKDKSKADPLGSALDAISGAAAKHQIVVLVVAALLVSGFVTATALWLRVDQDAVAMFPEDAELRRADTFFGSNFGGTHTLSVVLEGPDSRTMLAPQALKFLRGVQDELAKHKVVGKSVSLADFVRRMNLVMNRSEPEYDSIPDSQQLIAQYIQLYELSGDTGDFASVVDFNYGSGQVLVQLKSGSAATARKLKEAVTAYSTANLPSGYKLDMAGTAVRYEVVNSFIVKGQLWSLGLSLVTVFVMVSVLFLKAAAWGPAGRRPPLAAALKAMSTGGLTLLPILLAVAVNFGTMAMVDIPLEIGTAIVAACAVGIGIDYSVHFLHRYESARRNGDGPDDAIRHAARSSGRPIVFNAAAVSAGFMILMMSDFLSIRSLGWLTALTMLVTSLSALTILPALLKIRDGREA